MLVAGVVGGARDANALWRLLASHTIPAASRLARGRHRLRQCSQELDAEGAISTREVAENAISACEIQISLPAATAATAAAIGLRLASNAALSPSPPPGAHLALAADPDLGLAGWGAHAPEA